jgi:cell wall-associated NlpC family hydrolase
MGAAGPTTWDCSSFTQATCAQIVIKMPRPAASQRSWLAVGNDTRIRPAKKTRRPDLLELIPRTSAG